MRPLSKGRLPHDARRDPPDRAPERSDEAFWIYHALSALHTEGLASLVDKPRLLDPQHRATLEGAELQQAMEFAGAYENARTILTTVDSVIAAISTGQLDGKEHGRALREGLPWGGHPIGMFMARTIERALGHAALVAIEDPFLFLLQYDAAARQNGGGAFSPETLAYVRSLRERLVTGG